MDRFIVACLLILATMIAAIVLDLTVLQPSSPEGRAVAVALADPGMKDVLARDGELFCTNVA